MAEVDRTRYILQALARDKAVRITHLANRLGVSTVTIRGDLDELEAAGKLKRVHGGAVSVNEAGPGALAALSVARPKNIPNLALKEALAEAVAGLIAPGDSIFLGGGTTFYVIGRRLKQHKDLRIVTSNMSVVFELAPYNANIFFIGGELTECDGVYNTGGPKVAKELERIYVNKAFIGVSGIDMHAELTVYDLSQFTLFTSVKKIAAQTILVSDATKFGFQSAHRIGSVLDIADTILTNREVDERYLAVLREMNIPTILA